MGGDWRVKRKKGTKGEWKISEAIRQTLYKKTCKTEKRHEGEEITVNSYHSTVRRERETERKNTAHRLVCTLIGPHAFPSTIIKVSNLSSNPLPSPSRSHSPPISSNKAMLSL